MEYEQELLRLIAGGDVFGNDGDHDTPYHYDTTFEDLVSTRAEMIATDRETLHEKTKIPVPHLNVREQAYYEMSIAIHRIKNWDLESLNKVQLISTPGLKAKTLIGIVVYKAPISHNQGLATVLWDIEVPYVLFQQSITPAVDFKRLDPWTIEELCTANGSLLRTLGAMLAKHQEKHNTLKGFFKY